MHGSSQAKYSSGGASAPGKSASERHIEPLVYPALHLTPLNDTFVPKQIKLAPASSRNRIKIGRYSNNKSVPSPMNGYFDSKVLSRAHAEVWCENDKVYIKDIKSSNGTFINGTRLSPESQESEPYELHNEDVVDFGIDILTDDNKEVLHRRVACRVFLIITPDDALQLRNDFSSLYRGGVHGGSLSNAGLCPGAEGGFRRGKSSANLDHIIFRLQSELQKSKAVGSELHNLSSALQNVQDTLEGGAEPAQAAPYPELVPPRATKEAAEGTSSESVNAQDYAALKAQLANMTSFLTTQMDKIKNLEGMLSGLEPLKDDLALLRSELVQPKTVANGTDEFTTAVKGAAQLSDADLDAADDAASDTTTDTVVASAVPSRSRSPGMPAVDLASLVARIEALEEARLTRPRTPEPSAEAAHLPSILARLDRLEKSLQHQQSAEAPVSPEVNDPALAEWRATFEQRWREQSLGWEVAQQKINDVIGSWGDPTTPRVLTFGAVLDELDKQKENQEPRSWFHKVLDPTYQALGIVMIMLGLALPTALVFSLLKHILPALFRR